MTTANRLATVALVLVGASVILAHFGIGPRLVIPMYGVIVIAYVLQKMLFAELYQQRYQRRAAAAPDVSARTCDVAIAFYNEDPKLLIRSVESCIAQRGITLGKIIVVDDGSVSSDTANAVEAHFSGNPHVMVIRCPENRGKRHALATAIEHASAEFTALLDSDTLLEPDALQRLIEVFADDVAVVTGNVRALNRGTNWLTRLIDARFRNAFLIERAAHSYFGSVLCASGVLSAYRTGFLKKSASTWSSQTFLGQPVQFGDDRRLTGMALATGRAIVATKAIAHTDVPTTLRKFLKQQVRWNKSFIRESLIFVKDFGALHPAGFFSFVEVFFWLFYLSTIANVLFVNRHVGAWSLGFIWLGYVIATGLFRNIGIIWREPKLALLVPLYSLLHVLVLTPLRLYSLATILDTRWGTR